MRGQSRQAHLLQPIKAEARRSRNAAALARFDDRDDGYRAGPGEAAEELREMRAGRAAHPAEEP